ncbi:uncharacterized protein JCM6883_006089 [Sporobolomyces salmoneus]|uniref:uncharacterized protein n=1 Tax=Sporobolomyces salmoneus TaxID=183962 RepID=UPI00317E6E79
MQLALANGAGPLAHLPTTSTSTTRPNKTTARSVPAFLNKLYTMVSDPTTDDLIRWSVDGDSFLVPSADKFGKELLPRFFKHSNFGSFVRQLNMYGFHKVPHLNTGALKHDGGEATELLEFTHQNFARDQPDLLFFIRRQKAKGESNNNPSSTSTSQRNNNNSLSGPSGSTVTASNAASSPTALDLHSLLTDLSAIRKHQTAISADLKDLQQSNQLLWQEALASREKHRKQEDTINKILRFLAGVFGGQVLDSSGSASGNGSQAGVGGVNGSNGVSAANAASPGTDSNPDSVDSEIGEGARTSGNSKGKGKSKSHDNRANNMVGFPKTRSRLLLEDVKGRQQERAAALRELDGSEEDLEEEPEEEEEIEEIPILARDDDRFSRISSASHTSALPQHDPPPPPTTALTRTNSGYNALTSPSRFASLPPASPSAPNPFSNLDFSSFSPETMQQFLAAAGGVSDPSQYASLFNNNSNNSQTYNAQSTGGETSTTALSLAPASSSSSYDYNHHGIMIPSSSSSSSAFHPTTTPNPFDFGQISSSSSSSNPLQSSSSTTAPALSPSLVSSMNDHDQLVKSVIDEKQDIDRRTTELEDQISKLLKNLPEETRDQVLESDGPLGTASGFGTAVEEKGGFDWGNATGANGELDLDKLLEQFTNSPSAQPNHPTPGTSGGEIDPSLSTMDYSAFFPDPSTSTVDSSSMNPLYQSTAGSLPFPSDVDTNPITFPYEVTSPQTQQSPSFTAADSPASEVSTANESVSAPATRGGRGSRGGGGGGRKVTNGGRKRKSDVLSPLGEGSASPGQEGTRKSARKRS